MQTIENLRPLGAISEACDERVRAASAAILDAWVGLGPAGSEERLAAYAGLLYPHDDPASARVMARKQSSCALTAMALLRALGVDHEALDKPYALEIGKAVSIVVQVARERGTWVHCYGTGAPPPAPGCIVLLGGVAGQMEHVLTVTGEEYSAEGVPIAVSVEGGQADNGKSGAIQRARRVWMRDDRGLRVYAGSIAPPASPTAPRMGRVVNGYVDVASLLLDRHATVPDSFEALRSMP